MKYIIQNEDAKAIAEWYQKNKRQLPWRDTNNPYAIDEIAPAVYGPMPGNLSNAL